MAKTVIFSHGKESGPDGSKIQLLSGVARKLGYHTQSVDYRGCEDAAARIELLEDTLQTHDPADVILGGSSMGGYVSIWAAESQMVHALFLMCPATYMPGYEVPETSRHPYPMEIIHGLQDSVVPYENSIRLAKAYHAVLTLINDDHRLSQMHEYLSFHFECFLRRLG